MGAFALMADRVFDGVSVRDEAAVVVEDEHVVGVVPPGEIGAAKPVALPPGTLLAPGFVDVQVNGGGGVLFNDDPTVDGIATIAAAHRRFGTTGLLPTLISDSREAMRRAIDAVAEAIERRLPGVLGIHLEGPFLNVARKGVHPPEHILSAEASDLDLLSSLGRRGITLVTLAPECVPAGFVAELTRRGVIVCAGHTEATAAQILAAVEEGLAGFTHLFNAMSQLGSREPGAVGVALAGPGTFAGIIPDGHHVAELSLKLAWKAKGRDRLMLVTDAMSPVGTDLRAFPLFGRTVEVREGRCVTADGTLAGACLDMAGAVRFMVRRVGVPLEDALAMASRTPAAFLGLAPARGRLAPGSRADLVALGPDLSVGETWIGGSPARHRSWA
ncbi:MAG TPA: N-acetylglucosamine-6-phosphate deacetylase [Microvirga sp.]|nr:N-acetylglucosamine-6-phosphate deacetylase [Microvirga sp.]